MPQTEVVAFRQLRRSKGFDSDAQVANRAGMSRAALSLALAGKANLSDLLLRRLALVLEVPFDAVALSIRSEIATRTHVARAL